MISQIHKGESRVISINSSTPIPIWHDLIHTLLGAKSLLSVIVAQFFTEGNYLESADLELGIQTFLQTHGSARSERLTSWAIKATFIN